MQKYILQNSPHGSRADLSEQINEEYFLLQKKLPFKKISVTYLRCYGYLGLTKGKNNFENFNLEGA